MARWGIKVPFPDWEHWLWVTEYNTIAAKWAVSNVGDPKPISFGTKTEAQKYGRAWKTFRVAEIGDQ